MVKPQASEDLLSDTQEAQSKVLIVLTMLKQSIKSINLVEDSERGCY